jgi:hypothetical protein
MLAHAFEHDRTRLFLLPPEEGSRFAERHIRASGDPHDGGLLRIAFADMVIRPGSMRCSRQRMVEVFSPLSTSGNSRGTTVKLCIENPMK